MTKQTYISTNCQPYQSFQVASLPTSQLGWVPFAFTSKQIHPFQMVTHFFPLGCPYQIWISIPKLGPSMVPWRSRHGTEDGWYLIIRVDFWWFLCFFLVEVANICGWFPYIYYMATQIYVPNLSKHLLVKNTQHQCDATTTTFYAAPTGESFWGFRL